MGGLGSDVHAAACLPQPQAPRLLTWHPDTRLSAHSSTPFSVAFLDPATPGQLTDLNVTLLFRGMQVWAQAELMT